MAVVEIISGFKFADIIGSQLGKGVEEEWRGGGEAGGRRQPKEEEEDVEQGRRRRRSDEEEDEEESEERKHEEQGEQLEGGRHHDDEDDDEEECDDPAGEESRPLRPGRPVPVQLVSAEKKRCTAAVADRGTSDEVGSSGGVGVSGGRPSSWYEETVTSRTRVRPDTDTARRHTATTRSWYGLPAAATTTHHYGALSEEDLHSSPHHRAASSGRPSELLRSLVSMATLSRRKSCSTTALHHSSPARAHSTITVQPRKCETVVALSSLQMEPVNRLRMPSRVCSRCSSLLSMASSSRYSIDTVTGGFVQVKPASPALCKLCLVELPPSSMWTLQQCSCVFCIECMRAYVEFEINEGAYEISCPDALCEQQGVITMAEMERLVSADTLDKHKRFRLNREVELDKSRTWCPRAGCETVCTVCSVGGTSVGGCQPQSVHCPTCAADFCSSCRAPWHGLDIACRPDQLAQQQLTFDSELIKCCPMCAVPIEKDEGCAQMMCKRCKHVFCWYCLASLDDDFLLRHYDKGPCKNKLGHSRASVIWHRTQVIGIFAGFGILLLVASPLLLLAAPCIVCCKCRVCSSGQRLDGDDDLDDMPT
ncbi:uncharacterized protein LOC111059359 isoform X2 [Nilaparvata lugens]|uniref:uncharacterized protein LOC111059359 isoform X2 n=1 Tax=Nilaparvata lugens TaxID=108931 RepID=UPI00193E2E22|nr:uncharacterized protein LOC111059359 isoform X2 [Nilaparvata lugens]